MHGLTTIHKLNQANNEARRILNARDPGQTKDQPAVTGYAKAADGVLNASTGQPSNSAK